MGRSLIVPNLRSDLIVMHTRRLDHFRKKLLKKKDELYRMVSKTEQYGREADEESSQDVADKAASSYTKEFLFSHSSSERSIMQLVEEALDRVGTDSFGVCIACGSAIQARRLEAVPWTRYCISCQEKQEEGLLEESRFC